MIGAPQTALPNLFPREGETGLPWLRKLPLLGWLFKVDTQTDEKEELLIFITPKIVKLEQQI